MSCDRVFVAFCALALSMGVTVIGGLGLAAWSFGSAVTIRLPFVATFRGFAEAGGSHGLTIDASWPGVIAVVLLLAAPLGAVAIAYPREK